MVPEGDFEKKPPKSCLECRKKKGVILSYMTKQIIAYLLLEMHTCELSTFVCSSRMHGLDHLESGQLGISISLDLFVFYLNIKKTFLL